MSGGAFTAALVGNPNCGKSTLYNALTGGKRRTGNHPGVTVDSASGLWRCGELSVTLTDLPGIYALSGSRGLSPSGESTEHPGDGATQEELVTAEYLRVTPPDLILNVLDVTAPARSFPLTAALLSLPIPVITVLNRMDDASRRGIKVDLPALENALGVPVVPVSSERRTGFDMLEHAVRAVLTGQDDGRHSAVPPSVSAALGCFSSVPARRVCTADRLLTKPFPGIPCFLALAALLPLSVAGKPGRLCAAAVTEAVGSVSAVIRSVLEGGGVSPFLTGLLCDGVLGGIGAVLAFLPQLAILYTLFALAGDSGILARFAVLLHPAMQAIGLSGDCVFPLLLGWGCTVPALLSVRTVGEERSRRRALLLLLFVPCSARIPVFLACAGRIAGNTPASAVLLVLYLLSVSVLCILGRIFRRADPPGTRERLIAELPYWKLPHLPSVFRQVRIRCGAFLSKAGTVILSASALVWLTEHLSPAFRPAAAPEDSLLAFLGRLTFPLLSPLGLGDWRLGASLCAGLAAKEAVLSSLQVTGADALLTAQTAVPFLILVLFSPPCVSALAVYTRERNSLRASLGGLFLLLCVGYVTAWLAYRTVLLLPQSIPVF